MKQQKLTDYTPDYPRKLLRGTALAAAAIVALGSTAACTSLQLSGYMTTDDPGTVALDGDVAIDPGDDLKLDGEVAVDETPDAEILGYIGVEEQTGDEVFTTDGEEAVDPADDLILDGDVSVDETGSVAPDAVAEIMTTGMVYISEDSDAE